MTDKQWQQLLDQAVPAVPEKFHHAMTSALEQITAQESVNPPGKEIRFPRRPGKRRAALIIFAAVLLMTTIAAAVAGRDVFSALWGENVQMQQDFRSIIQHDVAQAMIGDYRVRVDEAAYDGVSLYIKYSFRDMTADQLLGSVKKSRKGAERRVFTYEDDAAISQWPVSLWRDGFWINGEYISIPAESAGYHEPGDELGEVELYYLFRLDNEGIALTGENQITLPLGRRIAYEDIPRDEGGELLPPEHDVLTFTINADGIHGIMRITDGPETAFPDGTAAWVSRADFTPIKLYLDIAFAIPEDVLAAYIQRAGSDGCYDDEGRLLYPYSGMDVASEWVYNMQLVDASGVPLEMTYGYADGVQGVGADQAFFVFPYMEEYPRPMYLAPVEDGIADMNRAILVLE